MVDGSRFSPISSVSGNNRSGRHSAGDNSSGTNQAGGRHARADEPSTVQPRRLPLAMVVSVVLVGGLITFFLTIPGGSRSPAGAADAAGTSATPWSAGTAPHQTSAPSVQGPTGSPRAIAGATEAGNSAVGCQGPAEALRVAAAPEIADIVRLALARQISNIGPSGSCAVAVTATDPADFVPDWQAGRSARPDVWIPDSSMWVAMAGHAGLPVPSASSSVATSPVVLAVAATTAQRLRSPDGRIHLGQILNSRKTDAPIRLGLPDPALSAASISTVLQVQSAVAGQPDGRAALTWAMLSTPLGLPTRGSELLSRLTADPNTALPVSEQALWAHNSTAGATAAVAVYSPTAGTQLDYPFVMMTADPARQAIARGALADLQRQPAVDEFLDAGFRDSDGHPGTALTADLGVDPAVVANAGIPTAATVDGVLHNVAVSNEPSRLLAVLDVSGSMATAVPEGGGATRLDFARAAAIRGLSLYPSDSEVGLWVFSRNLTPDSDHQELVPVGALSAVTAGVSGQQRVAQGLTDLRVNPDGGTGLYDTTLAAVRTMRAGWDPARVNAVLILSDGQNDDLGSISLTDLLSTLTAEQDPAHPVPVIGIAFGPDSDVSAMTAISAATGGATYVAKDPRDVGEIFLDAVGQRVCRPTC